MSGPMGHAIVTARGVIINLGTLLCVESAALLGATVCGELAWT